MDVVLPLLWTVRGGRAIDLRLDERARRTADLDVSLTGMAPPDLSGVRQLLTDVCRSDIGDGWHLAVTRLDRSLVKGAGVVGYKARLTAHHQSRPFGESSLDVSRASPLSIATLVLQVPEMLTGRLVRVAVVRPAVQVAEKFARSPGPSPRAPAERVPKTWSMQ
jgi:hypothetical protein